VLHATFFCFCPSLFPFITTYYPSSHAPRPTIHPSLLPSPPFEQNNAAQSPTPRARQELDAFPPADSYLTIPQSTVLDLIFTTRRVTPFTPCSEASSAIHALRWSGNVARHQSSCDRPRAPCGSGLGPPSGFLVTAPP
jgi:hypothetical protein